ncbi:unnamed protein product [Euphydryas editha]|uniref:DDE Tnp4 domain-containing protein n=1 Tax=Euphydryas editha TaxID=104508 RepID=A0AAU9TSE6_EUPED|nr:unnamed protein product [Euphydryas editha]
MPTISYLFVFSSVPNTPGIMKPYGGDHREGTKERIFNKKLSSARVIVENVFGVMSAVFRVLRSPMLLEPELASQVVMACVVLHNFLRRNRPSRTVYNPPSTFDVYDGDELIIPGSWRDDIPNNPVLRDIGNIPRRSPKNPLEIRNEFANYFYKT